MKQIRLFRGVEHPCSYLPGKLSRSAYVDTGLMLDMPTYSKLAEQGFRRSGDMVYRPQCQLCSSCVPARIPVARFSPSRSQLRTWQKNKDLTVTAREAEYNHEHYRLFMRYLAARHEDGGMADSNPEDYIGFLGSYWADTWFVEFKSNQELLAVAVVDRLDCGLSAVYTFFDPGHSTRGLGTFAVLWQIEEAKRLGLEWLYLGYWIESSPKMSYKQQFRPLDVLIGGKWSRYEKGEKIPA